MSSSSPRGGNLAMLDPRLFHLSGSSKQRKEKVGNFVHGSHQNQTRNVNSSGAMQHITFRLASSCHNVMIWFRDRIVFNKQFKNTKFLREGENHKAEDIINDLKKQILSSYSIWTSLLYYSPLQAMGMDPGPPVWQASTYINNPVWVHDNPAKLTFIWQMRK